MIGAAQEKNGIQPELTELAVTGMSCANCVRHVTQAIESVHGVRRAQVNLEARRAIVDWEKGTEPDPKAVVEAVEREGYDAKVVAASRGGGEGAMAAWRLNLVLGVFATALLTLGEWGLGLGMVSWFRWVSFALAGAVQVFAGGRFYQGAWAQLKKGGSNMDTLVALGSTTAFSYSAWALLTARPAHLYFTEAAAIITLVSLGHWLESRMSAHASSALRSLLDLAPNIARRLSSGGAELDAPVAELKHGDLIVLRPGDRIPTDGQVVEGDSAVDEAMLTGESAPVEKKASSLLYAGTVNLNGRLVTRVTATGNQTALAHIIAAVQRAQNSRANIQRLGDRVSSVFVPAVVAVALAAALFWGLAPASARLVNEWLTRFAWFAQPPESPLAAAFIIASAVLIVACPCAMGLATPVAIMAGSNAAARRGILIRDGVALEKAGHITVVLFDKTGTLTTGKPAVIRVQSLSSCAKATEDKKSTVHGPQSEHSDRSDPASEKDPAVQLAAALARHSTHPLSQAVAALASEDLPLADWREVLGSGIEARLVSLAPSSPSSSSSPARPSFSEGGSSTARLGSLRWLEECGVDVAPGQPFVEEWSAQAATVIGLAVGLELQGVVALRDTLKPGATEVVAELHRRHFKCFLVTGDNRLTAETLGRQIKLPSQNVFSEVRPEQKAELVRKLQQQGERVAFVGDGINDAPALEQADLGIAVSRASDIAREAADIILLNSEIEAVPESLRLARATLRVIKQNLFWAFFYNAVGVPLAALGLVSPILCAAAMGFSDLFVIGNALRLAHLSRGTSF